LPEDKGTLVIPYCGSPKCAAWTEAADYVAKLGYTNIKHYSAGIKGWLAKQSEGDANRRES
jgi:rhodanese-related sulfurtransferase